MRLACLFAMAISAVSAPVLAVDVDGRIDATEWEGAQHITDFRKVQPLTGEPASLRTEAWLLATPEGLAVAFRCDQPPGVPRTPQRVQRDFEDQVDRVNLMVDFDGTGRTGYNFVVSSTGGINDAVITNESDFNKDWDSNWQHAVSEDAAGWTVEMLIPWYIAPMHASRDGKRLYVTVGSNSNVAENGMDKEENRAAILEIDPATGGTRVFASGLRNPNGMGWQPQSGVLWTAVNERDEIGSDLVPDYMTSVKDGAFYGWPYSYYGQHVDERVKPPRPDLVAKAIAPDYALGPHAASLGLAFYDGKLLPSHYANGAFIGQHGSWNRRPPSGYKVIFVPFANGNPSGDAEDILTGFLNADGDAYGRPVGVAVDKAGALLVADDVGNIIWRVTPTTKQAAVQR